MSLLGPIRGQAVFSAVTLAPRVTELPFLADLDAGYVRRFRAHVQSLPPGGVVLDRTYFYPAGGGQPADRGTVTLPNGTKIPVTDVTKSGSTVVHRLGRPVGGRAEWSADTEVEGEIDWDRRYRHMRLHTAQHALSALVFQRTGLRTRRAVLQGSGGWVELEAPWPSASNLSALLEELNGLFARGATVRVREVRRAEFDRQPSARSGLVPLPANVDPVRLIAIEGLDDCPCGGTHVRSTAEVRAIELLPSEPSPAARSRISFTLRESDSPTPPA